MAGKNTYRERFKELEHRVGNGTLTGQLIVDQPYAAKQHVTYNYVHPRGGGPGYVSTPLYTEYHRWYQRLANHVLRGSLANEMRDVVEDWSRSASSQAPVQFLALRSSMNPRVKDGPNIIYDRPPLAPRNTTKERGKSAGRKGGRK